ncbi:MAG: carbohydrate kinase [Lachnospiraceae bacterium]|nr:carbohydrate kinase [Lachnospiraceae bacterium]
MKKKWDVLAFGELLIDFTQNGISNQGNGMFEANPGGAPCNVLAMLNKLGHTTAFMGKVGNDIFGQLLKHTLEELGIDTCALELDEEIRTTLAFVANDESGDRSFSFYRNPGADMMFAPEEVREDIIKNAAVFHFGTLSMTHDLVREATKKALKLAKQNDMLVSFDPNLRESLWTSLELAKEQVAYGLQYCDVLKISDNEILWFTEEEDYDKAVQLLQKRYEIPLILLSLGKDGSRAYYKNTRVEEPAFLQESTIDTTGAGDTFMGCCLHFILEKGLQNLSEADLREMLRFANAAAAIITTKRGALKVMPDREEIQKLLEK